MQLTTRAAKHIKASLVEFRIMPSRVSWVLRIKIVLPAKPTDCSAEMAAGRAFPVARHTITPSASAALSAETEEGRILL